MENFPAQSDTTSPCLSFPHRMEQYALPRTVAQIKYIKADWDSAKHAANAHCYVPLLHVVSVMIWDSMGR